MILQNLHTHSVYADGKDTLAEMARAAFEADFASLGFSEHGITDFDPKYSMSCESAPRYAAEVASLKEEYRGKMEILCGVEQDHYSIEPNFACDYRIGSVHYIKKDGEYVIVDGGSAEQLILRIEKYWNGDRMAMCEEYYEMVSRLPEVTKCDIIGHIDVITKLNEKYGVFDETDIRYKNAAYAAVDALCKKDMVFEINTGAMARGVRTAPYPAYDILTRIREKGGRILFNSDCHDKSFLLYGREAAIAAAKNAGFTEYAVLEKNGFNMYPIK
ncbi:MAG: histidinol-phosphatase HisJ family protein [Clostridia bacterium]|nr:histidinol-phosphatase HisJ family protein [Clostridia bacterium]